MYYKLNKSISERNYRFIFTWSYIEKKRIKYIFIYTHICNISTEYENQKMDNIIRCILNNDKIIVSLNDFNMRVSFGNMPTNVSKTINLGRADLCKISITQSICKYE